jgi:hypothetical protein
LLSWTCNNVIISLKLPRTASKNAVNPLYEVRNRKREKKENELTTYNKYNSGKNGDKNIL